MWVEKETKLGTKSKQTDKHLAEYSMRVKDKQNHGLD